MKPANEAALDAFLGLIAEKGFADVALRDVAEAAGLGLADLYRLLSRQGGAGGGLHGARSMPRCWPARRAAAIPRRRRAIGCSTS